MLPVRAEHDVNVGTSGYSYKFWGPATLDAAVKTDSYYPTRSNTKWLQRYAQDFKSVEINCTRYGKLKTSSCLKWVQTTPDDFTFTIKAPLYITHQKKLNDFEVWWAEFKEYVYALGKKFKCLLFQFPAAFKFTQSNIEKLQRVKAVIPPLVKCAFEFRNTEWFYNPLTTGMFKDNFTQVVISVSRIDSTDNGSEYDFGGLKEGIHIGEINPSFVYVRFHGTYRYCCGTYDNERLQPYVDVINEIRADARDTNNDNATICCYFNNTDSWTMLPFSRNSGDYSNGIPFERAFTPSAVYDARLMQSLLHK